MPQAVTTSQIEQYIAAISSGGVEQARQVYDSLYGAGYMYAGWAAGVARGDTITGQSALSYLRDTAFMGLGGDACRNLTAQQIDQIRVDMALGYLQTLRDIAVASGGAVARDVNYSETRDFHDAAFVQNGLSIENWTLNTPMELIRETLGDAAVEARWKRLRDTGGDGLDAIGESIWLANTVGGFAFAADPAIATKAQEWIDKVPGTANWDQIKKFLDNWGRQFNGINEIEYDINGNVNGLTTSALNWVAPRRDPLVLDLDGGGITTSGINAVAPILFDQDGDGTLTATGWIGAGEAIVVRDLNGNGTIDSGRELFGDNTILATGPNAGQTAANGFEALANLDMDANGVADGKFDSNDVAYASVKLWKDLNQDGTSQAGELFTFEQLGVASINVSGTASNVNLGGGNTQTFSGSFTKTDGTSGDSGTAQLAGSLLLANNNFYREFTDDPALTAEALALPQMRGSGTVRDLRPAMSLGTAQALDLQAKVAQFSADVTKEAQQVHLDALIQSWGATSAMQTSIQTNRTLANPAAGAGSITAIEQFAQGNPTLYAQITALEEFNGTNILERWVRADGMGGNVVAFSAQQEALLNQAYAALKESVYSALVVQTRLKPYLDSIDLVIDASGVHFDSSAINSTVQVKATTEPLNAVEDAIELYKYAGSTTTAVGLKIYQLLQDVLDTVAITTEIQSLLTANRIVRLGVEEVDYSVANTAGWIVLGNDGGNSLIGGAGDDIFSGWAGNDTITDSGGSDTIDGGAGDDVITDQNAGTNVLRGGDGNDTIIHYNRANDTIEGGAGNDLIKVDYNFYGHAGFANSLAGGAGDDRIESGGTADTYLFNRGDGQDTINDYGYNVLGQVNGVDRVIFGAGITTGDVAVSRSGSNLVLKVNDPANPGATDQITIENWNDSAYRIEQMQFADGTIWTASDLTALSMTGSDAADSLTLWSDSTMADGKGGNDTIVSGISNATIYGGDGNDTITDSGGNDTIDGGAGDDVITDQYEGMNVLRGGDGNDIITHYNRANDTIEGGAGNDLIKVDYNFYGYAGFNNVIVGGAGDDRIQSGGAADTYLFNRGDGQDTINDYGYNVLGQANGADKLIFGTGITTGDVAVSRSGSNLVLKVNDPANPGATDQITVENWDDSAYRIEQMQFADGTIWTASDLSNVITGTDGADTLSGWSDNGTLLGLGGNDVITDSGGNDLIYGGDGNDTITDSGGSDTIDGGAGDDVITDQSYGTNVLRGGDGNDTITFYNSANSTIEGGAGNDLIKVDLNTGANGATGNTFSGGAGDDRIQSGGSTDTYLFNRGDGQDTINDYGVNANAGADKLVFGSGIATTDVVLSRSGNNLVLKVNDPANPAATDQITIENWNTVGYRLEQVQFADGTIWTANNVTALSMTGTEVDDSLTLWSDATWVDGKGGNDTIVSGANNATIYGGDGGDTITDSGGSDTIDGGAGDDVITDQSYGTNVLRGGDGNDTITFYNSANSTIEGGAGNDLIKVDLNTGANGATGNTFSGGAGDDRIQSGGSTDTYLFNRGDGQDTINDYGVNANAGADKLVFGSGIATTDVVLSRSGNNLVLKVNDPANPAATDQITVENWSTAGYRIEQIQFADGGNLNVLTGGQGNDAYIIQDVSDVVVEAINEGTDTVETWVDYTLSANIENARVGGYGWTDVTGNELDNVITGNTGNNVLNGGAGADTLAGGEGNDTYVVDNVGDVVIENANEGIDTVKSSVSYTLGANVENLMLTGTDNINGTGNELDNLLDGNDGINVLTGGLGNDTYIVRNAGDVVIENANEGIDTVETHVDYTLGANIENARVGGWGWTDVTGNELDNVITGNSGNNVLNGGAGTDTLAGGEGNDTYVVDNAGDVVIENANEGVDTIQSSVSYTLSANVENLILTGNDAIDGAGNELDNLLDGNDGINVLTGGLGNDTYIVRNAGDVVVENANEGIDTIETHVDYTLGANIENARVGGWGWTDVTGNELDNVITGNTGNNVLNGGAGADTLAGGEGNDTYVVDNLGDVVLENANEGLDTIQSSVSYTLGANVENLTLTGSAALSGTGNSLDNVIEGNAGASTLAGGLGNDTYVIYNAGTTVVENANEGIDTVETHVDYTLGANIENARVVGWGWNDLTGNALNNVLTGNDGGNILDGGAGNDTLIGGAGNDKYQFGLGYGQDTVVENDATAGNYDKVRFGAGVTEDQLWFRHVGNDLEVSIIGTEDKMTIQDWYSGSANHVEEFLLSDWRLLTDTNVENLVQAMASFSPPAAGQTTLPQDYQNSLSPTIAANWQW